MTKTRDDRTPAQRLTHGWGVVARDRLMSGWGGATGGASRCTWAVEGNNGELEQVERWVRSRPEMRYVKIVNLNTYRPPRGTAHFHIYVVEAGKHPAIEKRYHLDPNGE